MILSSGLWDLRQVIGAAADSLVFESLAYLPTVPTWGQFANALLQADIDHHGSRFESAIVAAMTARGIGRGLLVATIAGPTTLAPDVTGEFHAQTCCGPIRSYLWRERTWCRGEPCADWHDVGSDAVLSIAFHDDAELELQTTSIWGDLVVSQLRVGVRPPFLVLEGPTRIPQRGQGTWRARFAAAGPATVYWDRTWRYRGAGVEALGDGLEKSFLADTSFALRVTLVDGLGRVVVGSLDVETFTDHPPPLASGVQRLTQHLDHAARGAETTVELTRSTRMSLVVYDVRGRVRERLWDGPAARGVHLVRWDASALEPGVYFLRLLVEPAGRVLRFVVAR